VLSHDGAIEVESSPGQGTMFRLYFPVAKDDEAGAGPIPAGLAMGNGQRVFYVDDEESLVRVGSRMLERLGFVPVGFTRSVEALANFRAAPDQVDAMVTDFNMPGKSGLALATEMLALRPGLCVVLSSGYISEELRQQALAVGINELIHKPNTIEELARALRAVPGVK
jgi:CheY-like chemotaxis protein